MTEGSRSAVGDHGDAAWISSSGAQALTELPISRLRPRAVIGLASRCYCAHHRSQFQKSHGVSVNQPATSVGPRRHIQEVLLMLDRAVGAHCQPAFEYVRSMVRSIRVALLALVLTGCVAAPLPAPVRETNMTYYWEPSVRLWYYNGPNNKRHYMPRNWKWYESGLAGLMKPRSGTSIVSIGCARLRNARRHR